MIAVLSQIELLLDYTRGAVWRYVMFLSTVVFFFLAGIHTYSSIVWNAFASMKLQKGYVDYNLLLDPESTKWRVIKGWNIIFRWSIPVNLNWNEQITMQY